MNPTVIRGLPLGRAKPLAPNTYRRELIPAYVEAQPYVEAYPAPVPTYYIQPTIGSQPYGQPYPVYAVPAYIPQPQMMSYNFHNYVKPKKALQYPPPSPSRGHNTPLFIAPQGQSTLVGVGGGVYPDYGNYPQPMGYSTEREAVEYDQENEESEVTEEENRARSVDIHMGVPDLYAAIENHFKNNAQCRVSWLNRLLAKINTATEFQLGVKAFVLYQTRLVSTTPETGTLLIKAACRSGLPEQSLDMLKDIYRIRIFPTLGGIHYLMINFSLRKDTNSVMETFESAKLRRLQPNTRTYHILIRECVDNGMIEEGMKFAKECEEQKIVPNRVTYNILMNGCRKFNRPQDILDLRTQMNQHKIEINDTTVKFTALAYMMLGNEKMAVDTFHEYPEVSTKLEEFCGKFFELTEEDDEAQKKLAIDLLKAVNKRTALPSSILERMSTVNTNKAETSPQNEEGAKN